MNKNINKALSTNIAVIIITHNRLIDAKISMELIRHHWSKQPLLKHLDIYHIYNGQKQLHKTKYLEDVLIYRDNVGHYKGAADLIDSGMTAIFKSKKIYEHIIVLSSDVFLIKPDRLVKIITRMKKMDYQLSTSLWPSLFIIPKYFSTEFFVISYKLAKKVFPLNLSGFLKKRKIDLFLSRLVRDIPIITVPEVELCFTTKVLKILHESYWSFKWLKCIFLLPGREIMWGINRFHTVKLGYFSHHDLNKKIKLITEYDYIEQILPKAKILQEIKYQILQQ